MKNMIQKYFDMNLKEPLLISILITQRCLKLLFIFSQEKQKELIKKNLIRNQSLTLKKHCLIKMRPQ